MERTTNKRKKPWGTVLVLTSAGIFILFTTGLGIWMLAQAVRPWVDSMRAVKELQTNGSRYYATSARSSILYDAAKNAVHAAGEKQFDKAIENIELGKRGDPHNPLFDYLLAVVKTEEEDQTSAVNAIEEGNAKGILRLYSPEHLSVRQWNWSELVAIVKMGNKVIDSSNDKRVLEAVFRMGEKIAWCEPPDFSRLEMGSELKKLSAEKLLKLSKDTKDELRWKTAYTISKNESILIQEKAQEDELLSSTSRAYLIAKVMRNGDAESESSSLLYLLEKEAEMADELRKKQLRKLSQGE